MPEKTLSITFSGICTIKTGSGRDSNNGLTAVYVIMPASPAGATPPHAAFVYVPDIYMELPPPAAFQVTDDDLGATSVYTPKDARVRIDPPSAGGPQYFASGLPVRDRPGPKSIAPQHDSGWLANTDDITPGVQLLPECNPEAAMLGEQVAMVFDVTSGVIKANFPCKTVQPQQFVGRPEIPKRVYASEFIVEMKYPENTRDVCLRFTDLRATRHFSMVEDLVLRWRDNAIKIRIGNDTEREIQALVDFNRCNIPLDTTTNPQALDSDFLLHYKLFSLQPNAPRPVPARSGHHTEHNGCLGVRNGNP